MSTQEGYDFRSLYPDPPATSLSVVAEREAKRAKGVCVVCGEPFYEVEWTAGTAGEEQPPEAQGKDFRSSISVPSFYTQEGHCHLICKMSEVLTKLGMDPKFSNSAGARILEVQFKCLRQTLQERTSGLPKYPAEQVSMEDAVEVTGGENTSGSISTEGMWTRLREQIGSAKVREGEEGEQESSESSSSSGKGPGLSLIHI